jgi:hypothetical protein
MLRQSAKTDLSKLFRRTRQDNECSSQFSTSGDRALSFPRKSRQQVYQDRFSHPLNI